MTEATKQYSQIRLARNLSEAFEIVSAVLIALFILSALSGVVNKAADVGFPLGLLSLLAAVIALFFTYVATTLGETVEEEKSNELENTHYTVTETRLATLEKVGIDIDILGVLRSEILPKSPLQGRDFLKILKDKLGDARATDKLDIIAKYTRLEPPKGSKDHFSNMPFRGVEDDSPNDSDRRPDGDH